MYEPGVTNVISHAQEVKAKPKDTLNHQKVLVNPDKILPESIECQFRKLNDMFCIGWGEGDETWRLMYYELFVTKTS